VKRNDLVMVHYPTSFTTNYTGLVGIVVGVNKDNTINVEFITNGSLIKRSFISWDLDIIRPYVDTSNNPIIENDLIHFVSSGPTETTHH
jgi:hypothetical protein